MAATVGIDFQHPRFSPVDLADVEGKKHTFCFATRLNGDRVSIEAFEEEGRLTVTDDLKVRGRFEWDDFGRILMTYEAWQFKLEVYDPSDEA